jgi:hypothetical protein
MGLDMYLYAKEQKQFHYWRKHNALHNWFTQLAIEKGIVSSADDFNCIDLPLTLEDLNALERDILSKNLKTVEGFFFGPTDYDPAAEMKDDLEAVAKAKEKIKEGLEITYSCWW